MSGVASSGKKMITFDKTLKHPRKDKRNSLNFNIEGINAKHSEDTYVREQIESSL